jgi:AcrR family transcriptional regulator
MNNDPIYLGSDRETPARADAVQNRADIIDAAQRLFTEHGVHAVSMTQIACEASVGKGTLYRHFRNKSDVCFALLDSEQRAFQEHTFEHLRATVDTPVESLQWFLEVLASFVATHIDLLFAAYQDRTPDESIQLAHPAHHWQWLTIVGLLNQMALDADTEYLADVLYTLLDPRTYSFQHYVRGYDHSRIVDGVLDTAKRLIK